MEGRSTVPPSLINPPPIIPGRRGLLAVATTPAEIPTDWLHGVTFSPESCAAPVPLPWVVCESDDLGDPAGPDEAAVWYPIMLRGVYECSTMGGLDRPERERRARAVLTATASHQAETELADGAASSQGGVPNLILTDDTGWVNTPDATAGAEPPAHALSALEQAMAECLHGQRGTIHATPGVVALWDAAGVLHMEGQSLVTANDNVIVAGSGYTALGDWAYGTGPVFQIRGAATPEGDAVEQTDRAQNTITTWVTQPSLVYVSPCCKVAAEVATTSP
jgi:hypothetical protein